jgi:hypothetical protein
LELEIAEITLYLREIGREEVGKKCNGERIEFGGIEKEEKKAWKEA